MSTTSDNEMSDCSNSPASYTSQESPHSSPPHHVPELTTLNTNSCTDTSLYKPTKNGNVPFLRIIEQPQDHFRFRYDTEKSGSTHGSILGRSYVDKTKKKTHPTVELVNYTGKALIKCSIKYEDKSVHKNIYKILEDEQITKSVTVPKSKSYKVGFPGIGIHTIKKTSLTTLLYNKLSPLAKKKSDDTTDLLENCDKLAKSIDQNVVRLMFSAHDVDSKREICEPVYSDPIYNKKNPGTNALKICRTSLSSGRPRGGEDIFLLVDKIDKNDVKVRFFEENENGERVWSAWGNFLPSDVHYQCAIVCRTPKYVDPDTSADVDTWIELVRTKNGDTSKPVAFKYIADPIHKQYKKRRIATPRDTRPPDTPTWAPCTPQSIVSDTSFIDQPVIVVPNDPGELRLENEVLQVALPPSSTSEWNINSNSSHIIENAFSQAMEVENPGPMWSSCLIGQPQNVPAQTLSYPSQFSITESQTTSCPPVLSIAESQTLTCLPVLGVTESQTLSFPPVVNVTESQTFSFPSVVNVAESQTASYLPIIGVAESQTPSYPPVISVPESQTQYFLPELGTTTQSVQSDLDDLLCGVGLDDLADLPSEYYTEGFGLDYNDLFPSEIKANDLVGDSGRTKEERTASSSKEDNAASSEQNDTTRKVTSEAVSRPSEATGDRQDGISREIADVTETVDKIRDETSEVKESTEKVAKKAVNASADPARASSNNSKVIDANARDVELLITTEVSDDLNATVETDNEGVRIKIKVLPSAKTRENVALKEISEGEGSSKSAGAGKSGRDAKKRVNKDADADLPIVFTPADEAEVKQLVNELCAMIRDKNKSVRSCVQRKLERLFDIRLPNGDTFLHVTLFKSQRSFEALVKMIHSVKMSHLLNYCNDRGESVLHLAVVHGSPELVTLLVSRGCDPAARSCEEETALHYAVRYGGEDTLRALLDAAGARLELDAANAERQSALHLCALHGRAASAALLGARGASGGARDAAGRTPLHLCAYDARADVARALLPHAAPHVHARDAAGRTPLAVAVASEPTPQAVLLARALLEAGARAEDAWPAARERRAFRDLLRPHLRDPARADLHDHVKSEPEDADESETEPDDDVSETDEDEYESADDAYEDAATESLSRKLGQMELSVNDPKCSASH